MKNIFFASLMIIIICFLPSCKDPCKDPSYYISTASDLKKWSFKPGSYWVYQDSVSGTIDSQSVHSYNSQNHVTYGSYVYTGDGGVCYWYTDIFTMSIASFWNGVPHDSFSLDNKGDVPAAIYVHYSSSAPMPSDLYQYNVWTTPLPETLRNYTVSGQAYPTVYKSTSNFNSQLYHVDNIGVIKWVFNDSINGQHTWNLLRYHVINL